MQADSSAFEFTGVSKRYGELSVVDLLDLSISKGEFVTILGPSGCGKSTILNMAAGFTPCSEGTISLSGRVVTEPGPDRGVCFQQSALFPWLTLWKNILFGPRARNSVDDQTIERAHHLLEAFGLESFHDHHPGQLSGGMQQRASIARILINNPDVLLMDEPFGALDAQTRLVMQTFLMDVQQEFKSTILFITHDVDEAIYMSDRVLILSGRPTRIIDEIRINEKRPRSQEYVLSDRFLTAKRRAFDGLAADN